jgi:MFS family permease
MVPSINVIGYYQTIMYHNLGIEGDRALLVTGIYNVVGPIFNLIFIVFFLDRVGRRKPLLFGTIAISVALICEAGVGSQVKSATGSRKDALSAAGVFFLFLVSCIFSVSFGPISWVYASEIMPLSIRGRGSAFATGFGNWLVGTVWSQVSPIGLGKTEWKFYFIFVAFNLVVTFPCIFFFYKVSLCAKPIPLPTADFLRKPKNCRWKRSICFSVTVHWAHCPMIWMGNKRKLRWRGLRMRRRSSREIRCPQCQATK